MVFWFILLSCSKDDSVSLNYKFIIAGIIDSSTCSYTKYAPEISLKSIYEVNDTTQYDTVDLNRDGKNDIILSVNSGVGAVKIGEVTFYNVKHTYSNVIVISTNKLSVAGPFSYHDTIDRYCDWIETSLNLKSCSVTCANNTWDADDKGNKYLGLRYINGHDTLYGWSKVEPSIAIYDFCLNK